MGDSGGGGSGRGPAAGGLAAALAISLYVQQAHVCEASSSVCATSSLYVAIPPRPWTAVSAGPPPRHQHLPTNRGRPAAPTIPPCKSRPRLQTHVTPWAAAPARGPSSHCPPPPLRTSHQLARVHLLGRRYRAASGRRGPPAAHPGPVGRWLSFSLKLPAAKRAWRAGPAAPDVHGVRHAGQHLKHSPGCHGRFRATAQAAVIAPASDGRRARVRSASPQPRRLQGPSDESRRSRSTLAVSTPPAHDPANRQPGGIVGTSIA
jgi:hypothetical protein